MRTVEKNDVIRCPVFPLSSNPLLLVLDSCNFSEPAASDVSSNLQIVETVIHEMVRGAHSRMKAEGGRIS